MMRQTPRKQNGFTLVEILMSLVIMGMLMAAVAVAFDASVDNYHANKGIYQTINTGRQALLRITNDLRTSGAVALIGIESGDDPDNTQVSLVTSAGENVTYEYDSTDNTLYYIKHEVSGDQEYVLCRNVTAMTFNRATFIDTDDSNIEKVRNVRVVMTVSDDLGDVTQTLAAASVVRRNL